MKIISIGTDRKIFEENSAVRQRQITYGKFFDELHLVVFTPNDLKFQNQKLSSNVFLYSTKSKTKILYFFDFLRIIRKILKNSKRDDIVLTCQDPFEMGLIGVFTKLIYDLPLHIQIHTDFMHKYFWQSSALNKARFLMAEFVIKYSNRVRTVSERVGKSINPFSENIDVLPIMDKIKIGSDEEIEKPFPFTLLMVCRLEKEKNIETILYALKNLEEKNIGLCLVGDGSQKSDLEKMAKNMSILDKVIFVGWQNNLAPYYKVADAFISASLYEGYGISTVEAAYFGKPLILSETGVAEEIFKAGKSAFVCDAKDSSCFVQSVLSLYQDKNLTQEMGQSAKMAADAHLNSKEDYFREYATSIIKTADSFRKKNFILRAFDFKKIAFDSFIVLRYFICGITSAGILVGSLYIFTDIAGIWYLYSSILAFFLSLIVSFILQKFVVFRDMKTGGISHQFSKFFIAAISSLTSNTIVMFVLVDVFGIWYILSQIITGALVMFQNFAFYKFLIFKK